MAIDVSSPRSRRAVLAAMIGAGAATVATAIRPVSAEAADGDALIVGSDTNVATNFTKLASATHPATYCLFTSGGLYALAGVNDTDSAAVRGQTNGDGGIAVEGDINGFQQQGGAVGVLGRTAGHHSQFGVRGVADPEGVGVHGQTLNGIGVLGQAPGGYGVKGETSAGRAVIGVATTGRGVHGETTSGRGVHGQATTGDAGFFTASAMSGTALRTVGRVKFDKSVGVATIASGTPSIVVTPGIDLTSTSAVVATLQGDAGGSTTVKRVTVNATNNTFTIHLTANSTASVKVAWHVFG